jgi:flagellar assembly factor FliW
MTMATREITSKPYGRISIQEQQIVHLPRGLFGFEDRHDYALLDSTTPPFYWLQNLEDPELAFILINPYIVVPEYVLDVSEEDLRAVESADGEDLLVFSIVTIPDDRTRISCNLQGPLLINRRARLARQAISLDQRWEIKHYLTTGGGE